jgi:hypothetical protein
MVPMLAYFPSAPASLRSAFESRARRYTEVHANVSVSSRTSFFAAAAVVTAAFARSAPTVFMALLSARLEIFNLHQACKIQRGTLYASGCPRSNTVHFVRLEQTIAQHMLEALRRQSKFAYEDEVARADQGLRRIALWHMRFRSRPHRELHAAVCVTRENLGRLPCFASQQDREILGNALSERLEARSASPSRTFNETANLLRGAD